MTGSSLQSEQQVDTVASALGQGACAREAVCLSGNVAKRRYAICRLRGDCRAACSSLSVKRVRRPGRGIPPPGPAYCSELGFDPGHHLAEVAAYLLDLVGGALLAHAGEVLAAGAVLGDPLLGELARLDLAKDLLHRRPRLLADDALATGHVAGLGG